MALTLQPIRGCPQHSGETGTRLSSAIHRRLFSRFFFWGRGDVCTQATQMEGWTTLGQLPSFCRCLYLIIYMFFLNVNIQTRGVVLQRMWLSNPYWKRLKRHQTWMHKSSYKKIVNIFVFQWMILTKNRQQLKLIKIGQLSTMSYSLISFKVLLSIPIFRIVS